MIPFLVAATLLSPPLPQGPLTRIGFGSCASQSQPQPVWDAVLKLRPQLFVFLGDNIYADGPTTPDFLREYEKLAQVPGFARLRRTTPLLATWDDGDFGQNDGGTENPLQPAALAAFNQFWGVRASRPDPRAVSDAVIVGPAGRRVQIILLDTRTYRSPLKRRVPPDENQFGRYVPDDDPNKTMLGPAQWAWLEAQLREPAEIRILASSIQVVPEDHGWEKWANLSVERDRLFNLVRTTGAKGLVVVSGDRHLAEISMHPTAVGYPLFELTASALNLSRTAFRAHEPNRWRVGSLNVGHNFGWMTIQWTNPPKLTLEVRDEAGDVRVAQKIPLDWLQPK